MAGHSWYAILQYFGRDFAGWQRQPVDRTVQGELEKVLARLDGCHVTTHAAGRTDAGVHALAQVVSFESRKAWHHDELARALNALLPDDVWVSTVAPAPAGFHARIHATARRYRYVVGCDAASFSPFRRPYEWALGRPLDAEALDATATLFRGEHDFRAFSATGQEKPHYRCNLAVAEWRERPSDEGFTFRVEADRFLHRMVRFLVGASVDVALGRRTPEDVARLLETTDNQDASPPAPPEGLYLVGVRYADFDKELSA